MIVLGDMSLVFLGVAVAGDAIAIGSVAERCLLSEGGGNTDIPFQGRQDRFGPVPDLGGSSTVSFDHLVGGAGIDWMTYVARP
jgi:hypothetical protein